MAAQNTDKLRKVARKWVGQVGAGGVESGTVTTVPLASTTNLPTETAIMITIDRVDANGVLTPDKEEGIIGVVSGDNLSSCIRGVEGTAQAHSAGAVVEVLWTARNVNDIVDAILAEHSQSGAHTTDTINEKTEDAGVTVDGVKHKDGQVYTDQINEKTDAAGVTIDGVKHKDGGVEAKSAVITTPDAENKASLTVNQNDVTNNPNAVNIVNTGDGIALRIDNDGDGYSLIIDSNKSVGIGTGATTPWTRFCIDMGAVTNVFGIRSVAGSSAAKTILTGKGNGSLIIGTDGAKAYLYWSNGTVVYQYTVNGTTM